jgi:hypothetical protein
VPYHAFDHAPISDLLVARQFTPRSLQLESLRSLRFFGAAVGVPFSDSVIQNALQLMAHSDWQVAEAALRFLVAALPSEGSQLVQPTALSSAAVLLNWSGSRERLKRARPLIAPLLTKYPAAASGIFSSLVPLLESNSGNQSYPFVPPTLTARHRHAARARQSTRRYRRPVPRHRASSRGADRPCAQPGFRLLGTLYGS